MKKYKEYMDNVRASDTLHQRLLGLEASGKRPIPWKRYGTMAAALVLVCGLGGFAAWAAHTNRWTGPIPFYPSSYQMTNPEITDETVPDIALVEPGDVTEPGEKTIGGYEVVSGSGGKAMTTYYILPYIDYGGLKPSAASAAQVAADWDIPQGAFRRDLAQDEIIALMGGEDAVNTHLDWGEYQLFGWGAWYEDGSFWGAYIQGQKIPEGLPPYASYPCPDDRFEFAVTAGQLPPTCIAYPGSVTQEVRGLTVTADGRDSVAGPEGGEDASTRRVSFMKDDYGYLFDVTGTSRALTEERVSRLVRQIADKGLALTYTCPYCGHTFPFGAIHHDPMISAEGGYTCPDCGVAIPVGDKHYHTYENGGASTEPYDPNICHYPLYDPNGSANSAYDAPPVSVSESPRDRGEDWCGTPNADPGEAMCSGYPVPDPGDGGTPDMSAPPRLKIICGSGSLTGGSGNYHWNVDLGNGLTSGTIACGVHPLDFREAPSLTTTEGTAKLSFAGSPDRVRVVCWPDSEWGNTAAAGQECSVAQNSLTLDYEIALEQGGWIYEVSAEWDGYGTASYVFYITKN